MNAIRRICFERSKRMPKARDVKVSKRLECLRGVQGEECERQHVSKVGFSGLASG